MAFQVFFKCFLQVFHTCLKCFIYLEMYGANVLFRCFENRSSVAHVAMAPVVGHHLPLVCELPDQCHGPIVAHQQL
jgi:hypothetical protein